MRYTIYCLTNNINGKKYVGQTCRTIAQRWADHVYTAKIDTGCRVLVAAIRKYGPGAFSHKELDVLDTREAANSAERFWIERLDCRAPRGYNLDAGGYVDNTRHESTKALLREAVQRGLAKSSPEQRSGRSKRSWQTRRANGNTGVYIRTAEQKERSAACARAMHASRPQEVRSAHARKMNEAQWSRLGPEERSDRARAMQAKHSSAERSEIARKRWAAVPLDERRAAMARAKSMTSPESEAMRKALAGAAIAAYWASLGPEQREVRVQKLRAAQKKLTPEQCSARAHKAWATKRAKARTGPG